MTKAREPSARTCAATSAQNNRPLIHHADASSPTIADHPTNVECICVVMAPLQGTGINWINTTSKRKPGILNSMLSQIPLCRQPDQLARLHASTASMAPPYAPGAAPSPHKHFNTP